MLNTILDTIFQAYLEEDFNKQFGINSSLDYGNSNLEFLNCLRDSNEQVTVKIKREDMVSEEKWFMEDIIGIAIGYGEEVGFKNGFLVGSIFGNQLNSQPMLLNCKNLCFCSGHQSASCVKKQQNVTT